MIAKSRPVDSKAELWPNKILQSLQPHRAYWVFLAFILFNAQLLLAADPEAGAFFIQQYSPKIYAASPQNWAVTQDRRGVMYFGNTEGVLEYDGATWRKIIIRGARPALSLALDQNGTVFVGSENELGYLKADSQGILQYASLLDHIPQSSRSFGYVWSVVGDSSGVWFQTRKFLFHWNPQHGMTVVSGQTYGNLFSVNGQIFVEFRHAGLHRLQGDSFEPIPGGRIAGDPVVQGVFSFHGSVVVATPEMLYKIGGPGLQKWQTSMDERLHKAGTKGFLPLRNGELAIGTIRSGLLLMDSGGNLSRIVSKAQELRSDVVNNVYEDRQGGVWLALDRGLARVEVELPATIFGEREGISEMVTGLERGGGNLYAGTAVGLSLLVPSHDGAPPQFIPVSGIQQTIDALLPTRYGLMAGGIAGIWEVHQDRSVFVEAAHQNVYDLALSAQDPDILYAACRDGLSIFRRQNSGWEQIWEIGADGSEFRTVVEADDGRVWVTSRSAVLRIDWKGRAGRIERFGPKEGVPPGWTNAYRLGKRVVFATSQGLRVFDEDTRRFSLDQSFGEEFSHNSRPVSLVRQSADGDVWVSGEGYHGILHKDAQHRYVWKADPLGRSNIKELYVLHLDPDDTAWASGMDGGLTRLVKLHHRVEQDTPVLLRRIEVLTSSRLAFGGETPFAKPLRLRHADNALRFVFASPNFGDEAHTEYQVFLEGLDRKWSAWSSETQKEYTNLFEKNYKFRVRARGVGGQIGPDTTFSFRVLAPWYRTWWAYLLYIGAFSAGIVFFIKWRLAQLEASNRRLEQIIGDRTLEIRKQRDKIQAHEAQTEALLLNILPHPVANELRSTGSVEPLLFNNVAVCFTDFVGFTLSSEQLSAPELVKKLDRYFTAFDEVIGRFGLEKLKTIGDAYMFVGGLPAPKDSYAVDTVLAALELVRIVEDFYREDPGSAWKIRIGIHCGPVIAGVVGVRKFAFDIWGETVNRASRMESCSKPNRVNVSRETYEQVKGFLDFDARGPIATKEGRTFDMYFAKEPESENDLQSFSAQYKQSFGATPPDRLAGVAPDLSLS